MQKAHLTEKDESVMQTEPVEIPPYLVNMFEELSSEMASINGVYVGGVPDELKQRHQPSRAR